MKLTLLGAAAALAAIPFAAPDAPGAGGYYGGGYYPGYYAPQHFRPSHPYAYGYPPPYAYGYRRVIVRPVYAPHVIVVPRHGWRGHYRDHRWRDPRWSRRHWAPPRHHPGYGYGGVSASVGTGWYGWWGEQRLWWVAARSSGLRRRTH